MINGVFKIYYQSGKSRVVSHSFKDRGTMKKALNRASSASGVRKIDLLRTSYRWKK